MYNAKKDKKVKNEVILDALEEETILEQPEIKEEKENELIEKTIEIKGMMCGHCEATVKKALEKLPGVEEAIVSHEAGTAVVKMSEEVADDVLRSTVEDKDYEVVGIV